MADCQLLQVSERERSLCGELEAGSRVEGMLEEGAELSQSLDDELGGQGQEVKDPGGCGSHDNHMTTNK